MANEIKYGVRLQVNANDLKVLKSELDKIAKMSFSGEFSKGKTHEQLRAIKQSAEEVGTALEKAFNIDLGTLNISKFNQQLKGLNVQKIANDLESVGFKGTAAFRNIVNQSLTMNLQLKETHKTLDKMAETMGNTIKWGLTSRIFNSMAESVQNAWNYTKALDSSLNDIRIVTGKSADEMARFAVEANKAAQKLGAGTKDFSNAALIYYQQGDSDAVAKTKAETTIKAANVTQQDAAVVSEQLTAVWNGYKVSAQQAELYIDKLSAVAATTAADLEELSTGMSKVASAANLMGVDIDQLNATLATVVSVTRQAPESVGTAFKTIYARMGDIKAGLDTETTLDAYTQQMLDIGGVNVLNAKNELRDMGEVIEEVGNKWSSMSREQQVALSQVMAGTRQYNNLLSLFDNWDMYEEALATSQTSAGELQRQQDIYMDRIEAHAQQLETAWERVWNSMVDTDSTKTLIDTLTSLTNGVANFVEMLGGGGSALSFFGTIGMRVFSKQIGESIATVINNFRAVKDNTAQMRAELEILQQYKGLNINDESTKHLIQMKEQILDLNDVASIEQKNQANEMINATNEIYKQRDAWIENKRKAEEYFNQFGEDFSIDDMTKGSTSGQLALSLTDSNIKTADENIDKIVNVTNALTKCNGALIVNQGEITKSYGTYEKLNNHMAILSTTIEELNDYNGMSKSQYKTLTVELEEYADAAKNVTTAQKNLTKAQEDLAKAEKDLQSAGDNKELTEKSQKAIAQAQEDIARESKNVAEALRTQSDAAKTVVTNFGKVNAEFKNGAVQARQVIDQQLSGFGDTFENRLKMLEASYQSFINNIKTVQIVQQFVQLTASVGQLAQSINMLKNIGSIWKKDDITAGEKVLQTVMALGTALPLLYSAVMGGTKAYLTLTVALKASTAAGKSHAANNLFVAMMEKLVGKEAITAAGGVAVLKMAMIEFVAIAAVVIALVVAITGAIEASEAAYNKDANAAKAAAQAATEVAEANDKVQQSLENLKNSFGAYDTAVEKLKNCIEGTEEWKEALEGVNSAAIDVLDAIPANVSANIGEIYKRDSNGQIVIDPEKMEEVLDIMEASAAGSKIASATMEKVATASSNNSKTTDLSRAIAKNSTTEETEIKSALSTLVAEFRVADLTTSEFKDRLEELGVDISQFNDNEIITWRTEISKMAQSADNAASKLDLITNIALQDLLPDSSQGTRNTVETRMEGENFSYLSDFVNSVYDDVIGKSLSGANKDAMSKTYGEILSLLTGKGYDYSKADDPYVINDNQLEIHFFDNETQQDIKYTVSAVSEIAAAIKSEQMTKQWGAEVDAALENYRKNAGDDAADALQKYLDTGSLDDLTTEQIKLLRENGGTDSTKLAELMGITVEELYKRFGTSKTHLGLPEDFGSNPIDLTKVKAPELSDYVESESKVLHDALFKLFNITTAEDITANQRQLLANIAEEAFTFGGEKYLNSITDLYSQLDSDNVDEFVGAIQNVKGWSHITAEELQTKFHEAGIEGEFSVESLNNLIDSMERMQYSAKTLSSIFSSIEKVTKITDGLQKGSTLSKEDYSSLYNEMSAAGVDISKYFTKLRNGTYELIESTEDFQDVINNFAVDEITAKLEETNRELAGYDKLNSKLSKDTFDFENYVISAEETNEEILEARKKAFEEEADEAQRIATEAYNQVAEWTRTTLPNGRISTRQSVQTQYGNIDLDNRAQFTVGENLPNIKDWVDDVKAIEGEVATVLGAWGEYGENKVPIAFSPILQTGEGQGEILDENTLDNYINQIVSKSDGSKEDILRLDAEGITINGKKIQNIIADIGDTAEKTAEKMHKVEEWKALQAKADSYYGDPYITEEGYGAIDLKYPDFENTEEDVQERLETQFAILSALYDDQEQLQEWIEAANSETGLTTEQYDAVAQAVEGCRGKYEELAETMKELNNITYEASLQILKQYDNVRDLKNAYEEKKGTVEQFNGTAYTEALLQLEDEHRREDFNDEEIERYADYLQDVAAGTEEWSEDLKDNAEAAEDLSIQVQRMNKGVDDLADNWKDWSSILKKTELKGSEEYFEALTNTQEALSDLLDIEPEFLSDGFITTAENMELISKAAEGNEEAIDSLRQNALKDIVLNIELDESAIINNDELWARVQNIQTVLDQNKFKWGAEVDLTGLQVGEQSMLDYLNTMILEAGMSVDQVNAMLAGMGFTANFASEPQKVMIKEPDKVTTHHRIENRTTTTMEDGRQVEEWDDVTTTTTTPGEVHEGEVTAYSLQTSEPGTTVVPKINSLNKKATGVANNYSSRNAGGGSPGKGSGGSKKAQKMDKVDKTPDRYHKVNTQLDKIGNQLDKIQSQEKKLTGAELIENINAQLGQLDNRLDQLREKVKIAQGEAGELRDSLANQGVKFNDDGTIANYMEIYNAKVKYVNDLIDKYNTMSAEEQEKYKETVEQAKEDLDKFTEDLDRYDELVSDFIPGLNNEIQDAIDEEIELNIKKFNLEFDVRLNMKDATKDWNEFKKRILDGIDEDDIYGNAKARATDDFSNMIGENGVQASTKQAQEVLAELKEMDATGWSDVYGDDRATALEDLKTAYETINEDLMEIDQIQKDVYQAWLDTMDEINDKMADQVAMYEQVSNLIDHDMKVIQLIYGETDYEALGKYYDKQHQNNLGLLDFQRQNADFWEKEMNSIDKEKDPDAWKKARDNWISAVNDLNATVEASIENARDKMENTIDDIFQKFNNEITDGKGLDYLAQQWDLVNDNADDYLDTVNAAFGIRQLENKYQDAIDLTDNISAQRKLNDLMESELKALREKDKLTEYDIERANMKYEIALKQIALEEAQQTKTTMRLRRDSQGNYRYEYIADEDAIGKLQDELDVLENSLYNFDKERWIEMQNQVVDAVQERQDAIKEIMMDASLSEEERAERLAEINRLYNEKIQNITDQTVTAQNNLYQSGADELAKIWEAEGKDFQSLSNEEQRILTEEMLPQFETGVNDMITKFSGPGGFEDMTVGSMENLKKATDEYNDELDEIEYNAGVSFDKVEEGIDKNIPKTEQLIEDNDTLNQEYQEQIDKIKELNLKLQEQADKYKKIAEEAKKATQEAYNYWMEQQRQAAEAAEQEKKNSDGVQNPNEGNKNDNNPTNGGNKNPTGKTTLSASDAIGVAAAISLADNYGGWGTGATRSKRLAEKFTNNNDVQDVINRNGGYKNLKGEYNAYKNKLGDYYYSKFDTGGYTGDWAGNYGKFAMLHSKELVLNAHDTDNMLNMMQIARDVIALAGPRVGALSAGKGAGAATGQLEQNVHIEANFPNVESASEIEEALNNLVQLASQRATRNTRG